MDRPGWDEYFLGIAAAVAARADCTRRQVGAVIVKDHRIVATGYNGAPAGRRGCLSGACPRGRLTYDELAHQEGSYDSCVALHAEVNACVYAGRERSEGATIYITCSPCQGCLKVITASGIICVVTPNGRWEL